MTTVRCAAVLVAAVLTAALPATRGHASGTWTCVWVEDGTPPGGTYWRPPHPVPRTVCLVCEHCLRCAVVACPPPSRG